MAIEVARAVSAEALICGVDTPELALELVETSGGVRVVAATPNPSTYDALAEKGHRPLKLAMRTAEKYKQARYVVSIALRAGEVAAGDGAFVVRGDGLIRTAGAFLTAPEAKIDVPAGLGARHLAAAGITAATSATAVVVSSTDGFVRVFSGGELVLQMDPELPPTRARR